MQPKIHRTNFSITISDVLFFGIFSNFCLDVQYGSSNINVFFALGNVKLNRVSMGQSRYWYILNIVSLFHTDIGGCDCKELQLRFGAFTRLGIHDVNISLGFLFLTDLLTDFPGGVLLLCCATREVARFAGFFFLGFRICL